MFGPILASILGDNLPNIVKSAGSFVTGILDNISSDKPLDISGNLSKGVKSLVENIRLPGVSSPPNQGRGEAINSVGGSNLWEPNGLNKQKSNVANNNLHRFAKLNSSLFNKNSAVNSLPIVTGDTSRQAMMRGRVNVLSPLTKAQPLSGTQGQLLPGEVVLPFPDGGLTGRRNGLGIARKKIKVKGVALRNVNGYKGLKTRQEIRLPSFQGNQVN